MKRVFTTAMVFGLVAFTGCNQGTPGGPGATNRDDKKTHLGQGENSFSLSMPSMPGLSTKVKQGESKEVTIGIKRGKNFDQDVTLKFDSLPQGVTIDPAAPVIKHSDSDAKVTVKAAGDAALGDFTVKVTGHPKEGPDATNELKIKVEKKK
jgi:hypothetical protein